MPCQARQEVFDVSEDNPDALPPASYLGDFARAYPNAKLLYRADDPFQNTGPGEVWDSVGQQWEVLYGGLQIACSHRWHDKSVHLFGKILSDFCFLAPKYCGLCCFVLFHSNAELNSRHTKRCINS